MTLETISSSDCKFFASRTASIHAVASFAVSRRSSQQVSSKASVKAEHSNSERLWPRYIFATVIGALGGGASKSVSTNSIAWLTPSVAKTRRVNELKNVSAISHAVERAMSDE